MPKRPNSTSWTHIRDLAEKKGYSARRIKGTIYIDWGKGNLKAASSLEIETLELKPDYVPPEKQEVPANAINLAGMNAAAREKLILEMMGDPAKVGEDETVVAVVETANENADTVDAVSD